MNSEACKHLNVSAALSEAAVLFCHQRLLSRLAEPRGSEGSRRSPEEVLYHFVGFFPPFFSFQVTKELRPALFSAFSSSFTLHYTFFTATTFTHFKVSKLDNKFVPGRNGRILCIAHYILIGSFFFLTIFFVFRLIWLVSLQVTWQSLRSARLSSNDFAIKTNAAFAAGKHTASNDFSLIQFSLEESSPRENHANRNTAGENNNDKKSSPIVAT